MQFYPHISLYYSSKSDKYRTNDQKWWYETKYHNRLVIMSDIVTFCLNIIHLHTEYGTNHILMCVEWITRCSSIYDSYYWATMPQNSLKIINWDLQYLQYVQKLSKSHVCKKCHIWNTRYFIPNFVVWYWPLTFKNLPIHLMYKYGLYNYYLYFYFHKPNPKKIKL